MNSDFVNHSYPPLTNPVDAVFEVQEIHVHPDSIERFIDSMGVFPRENFLAGSNALTSLVAGDGIAVKTNQSIPAGRWQAFNRWGYPLESGFVDEAARLEAQPPGLAFAANFLASKKPWDEPIRTQWAGQWAPIPRPELDPNSHLTALMAEYRSGFALAYQWPGPIVFLENMETREEKEARQKRQAQIDVLWNNIRDLQRLLEGDALDAASFSDILHPSVLVKSTRCILTSLIVMGGEWGENTPRYRLLQTRFGFWVEREIALRRGNGAADMARLAREGNRIRPGASRRFSGWRRAALEVRRLMLVVARL